MRSTPKLLQFHHQRSPTSPKPQQADVRVAAGLLTPKRCTEEVPSHRSNLKQPKVLLIGNYEHDLQESMQRFANLLVVELPKHGVAVEIIRPRPLLGRLKPSPTGVGKWLGYLDKFVLFPRELKSKLRALSLDDETRLVVHVCDHSNAFYTPHLKDVPHLVTCHDLLAVRGALGEDTDCPASPTGRFLQRMILSGLKHSRYVACDSGATRADLLRLASKEMSTKSSVVLLSTNYGYKPVDRPTASRSLQRFRQLDLDQPYLLHVGHNMKRKNRAAILRIMARIKEQWQGNVVFAGDPLDDVGLQLAESLGIRDRVVQVAKPSNAEIEALYSMAFALVYPSRAEGFGWPIIEAQACGCPVVCSDQTSVPEVAGNGAIVCGVDDHEAFAEAILRLTDEAYRKTLIQAGHDNLMRFSLDRMMSDYVSIYRSLLGEQPTDSRQGQATAAASSKEATLRA